MKEYTYSEARQRFASVLDKAIGRVLLELDEETERFLLFDLRKRANPHWM